MNDTEKSFYEKDASDHGATMREVVANRVNKALQYYGGHAADAWERLKEQGRIMMDHLVPVGKGGRLSFMHSLDNQTGPGKVLAIASSSDGGDLFVNSIHNNAFTQMGEKLGVPGSFLRELANGSAWQREAAAGLLNRFAANYEQDKGGPQTMMFRSVGHEVRGVLSDKYKRLDTQPIFGGFLTSAYAHGAKLYKGELTDLRCHMEVLLPEIHETTLPNVPEPVYTVFGARISSSDFGQGSLEVRGFYMQGACLNGMVRFNVMREVHLGRRLEMGDIMSDETRKADSHATKLLVNDSVVHVLSAKYREQTLQLMQAAAGKIVDVQKEVQALNKFGLTKAECDEVDALIMNGRSEDGVAGGPSAWKVVQGITAIAREKDANRSLELQTIASSWLDKQLNGMEARFEKELAEK